MSQARPFTSGLVPVCSRGARGRSGVIIGETFEVIPYRRIALQPPTFMVLFSVDSENT